MGLYNFQLRFVPFILDGRKTHTIRATRVNPDRPGNTLHLYTGLRHKGAKLLMRVPCAKIEEIIIADLLPPKIWINEIELDHSEKEQLAKRDGFKSFSEMMDFWNGRLPFRGQIIHWRFEGKRRGR